MLVLQTLGAPERRGLVRNRRPVKAEREPDPAPVTTTRVTLVGAEPFASDDAAAAWLREADGEAETEAAVAEINRVLHAHRIATADPTLRDVGRRQAIVVRVGIGDGDAVSEGRWADAYALPPLDRRGSERKATSLRPQERLAALLTGRDVVLACEDLVLRARADLDGGRTREAALQVRVALEAALAELEPWTSIAMVAERMGGLREQRVAIGAAANAALQGGLDDEAIEDVALTVRRLEAILRARTAHGFDAA